jgi:serine/threonine protein phosphatase PrpC
MITANPDIVVENLTSDINFIVIACDGIWDCMTNQECCDFITEKLRRDPKIKLSKIIEEMFDLIIATDIYTGNLKLLILETGVGCDNMTCVIIQFKH